MDLDLLFASPELGAADGDGAFAELQDVYFSLDNSRTPSASGSMNHRLRR